MASLNLGVGNKTGWSRYIHSKKVLSISMASTQSAVETKTLSECYSTLVTCIQQSPASIADRLRGLLPSEVVSYLSNHHHDDDDKARKILDTIIEKLPSNRGVFHEFLKVLDDAGDWTKSVLKKVKDTYEKHMKETLEYRTVLTHKQNVVKTWKEEISKGQAKPPRVLYEDSTFKRPPTLTAPPESVEQYLSAVLESVEVDCGYYDDFLDVLKRLGQWGEVWAETLEEELIRAEMASPTVPSPPSKQVSRESQTIMPLPPKLQVHVPIHSTTIKATPSSQDVTFNKEKFTLEVTIRDAATSIPLDCLVGLQGDSAILNRGQLTCLLSLSVSNTGSSQAHGPKNEPQPEYKIWRSKKSKYSTNGQVTFHMHFYEANTNYIVTLGVASVIDEEGIECMGYTVEHYTGFVSTYRTVERGAFKAPALKKYEGEIASPRFNKLMSIYNKLFYSGDLESSKMIRDRMTLEGSTTTPDVKLYLRLTRAAIPELEDILEKSASCRNAFLLEGEIMMTLSQIYALKENTDKALECIHHSRSICLEAAPSHLTSSVFHSNAWMLIDANKGNTNPEIKQRILELFDRCIADSYYTIGWQRVMIFNGHINKALFCLNGTMDRAIDPTLNYSPTSEDISLAEKHLEAAPLDGVEQLDLIVYNIAMSDLHRWKGEKSLSREYAERAKTTCMCVGKERYTFRLAKVIDARLDLLGPDTMDGLLEQFKDTEK